MPESPSNTWSEYLARLEQELRQSPDAEGFRHAAIAKPNGESITFRSFTDLRAEINWVRNEVLKETLAGSRYSPFFAECAP